MSTSDIFLALLAVLFPPIAVWIKSGICTCDSLINILLCCLGYLPGLLHAWYIIALYPEPSDDYETMPQDGESGRVTYYYISHRPSDPSLRPQAHPQGQQPPPRGYGTLDSMRLPQQNEQQQSQSQTGVIVAGEDIARHGEENGVPPSYEQAIQGDHKMQT